MNAATPLERQVLDPVDELARRSRRLAQVVESSSRRRDCRDFRARILLLVLHFACPTSGRPRRTWYVRGAAARIGPDGLRRAWKGFFGEDPKTLRSFRSHLGALENALALVRSPGDWMPRRPDPSHPERRPRYPETIHVLQDDLEALWWEGEGERLRAEHPKAQHNPTEWRAVFGGWRERAARGDLDLVQIAERAPAARRPGRGPTSLGDVLSQLRGAPEPQEPARQSGVHLPAREAAGAMIRALQKTASPWALLRILEPCGAGLRGIVREKAIADPGRFSSAVALLAIGLLRDDGSPKHRIRSRAGWLRRAFECASDEELERSTAQVLTGALP